MQSEESKDLMMRNEGMMGSSGRLQPCIQSIVPLFPTVLIMIALIQKGDPAFIQCSQREQLQHPPIAPSDQRMKNVLSGRPFLLTAREDTGRPSSARIPLLLRLIADCLLCCTFFTRFLATDGPRFCT